MTAIEPRTCARTRGCTNGEDAVCLVCPYAFRCPTCHAQPGRICRRPSGHNAASIHIARVAQADREALEHHRGVVAAQLGETSTRRWERKLHA